MFPCWETLTAFVLGDLAVNTQGHCEKQEVFLAMYLGYVWQFLDLQSSFFTCIPWGIDERKLVTQSHVDSQLSIEGGECCHFHYMTSVEGFMRNREKPREMCCVLESFTGKKREWFRFRLCVLEKCLLSLASRGQREQLRMKSLSPFTQMQSHWLKQVVVSAGRNSEGGVSFPSDWFGHSCLALSLFLSISPNVKARTKRTGWE